jgi:hypothetical protein
MLVNEGQHLWHGPHIQLTVLPVFQPPMHPKVRNDDSYGPQMAVSSNLPHFHRQTCCCVLDMLRRCCSNAICVKRTTMNVDPRTNIRCLFLQPQDWRNFECPPVAIVKTPDKRGQREEDNEKFIVPNAPRARPLDGVEYCPQGTENMAVHQKAAFPSTKQAENTLRPRSFLRRFIICRTVACQMI